MLAIAVQAKDDIVALLACKAEAGLHGGADPQVKRMAHYQGAGGLGLFRGPVGRTVVNDEYVSFGKDFTYTSRTRRIAPCSL